VYTGIMDGCTLVALCPVGPVHAIQVASSVLFFFNIVYLFYDDNWCDLEI